MNCGLTPWDSFFGGYLKLLVFFLFTLDRPKLNVACRVKDLTLWQKCLKFKLIEFVPNLKGTYRVEKCYLRNFFSLKIVFNLHIMLCCGWYITINNGIMKSKFTLTTIPLPFKLFSVCQLLVWIPYPVVDSNFRPIESTFW